jgi:hypothetical protein
VNATYKTFAKFYPKYNTHEFLHPAKNFSALEFNNFLHGIRKQK